MNRRGTKQGQANVEFTRVVRKLWISLSMAYPFSRAIWNEVTQAVVRKSKWENITLVDWIFDWLYHKTIKTYKALSYLFAYGISGI